MASQIPFKKNNKRVTYFTHNLVLRKTHLCSTVEERVTDSGVINFELVDTVDVGNFKFSTEKTVCVPL